MSPRRTRPARRSASTEALDDEGDSRLAAGFELVEVDARGEEWVVRRLTGVSSTKTYRCPGCNQEIRPTTPHLVVWPSLAVDMRRHWHTPCWKSKSRRPARELRPGR
jgi:hypothetical protein